MAEQVKSERVSDERFIQVTSIQRAEFDSVDKIATELKLKPTSVQVRMSKLNKTNPEIYEGLKKLTRQSSVNTPTDLKELFERLKKEASLSSSSS